MLNLAQNLLILREKRLKFSQNLSKVSKKIQKSEIFFQKFCIFRKTEKEKIPKYAVLGQKMKFFFKNVSKMAVFCQKISKKP